MPKSPATRYATYLLQETTDRQKPKNILTLPPADEMMVLKMGVIKMSTISAVILSNEGDDDEDDGD